MEDSGKKPLIEEDEFQGSGAFMGNLKFRSPGAYFSAKADDDSQCNIASSSSSAAAAGGKVCTCFRRVEETTGADDNTKPGETIQENKSLPADESSIFYEFTQSDIDAIQGLTLADECSTSRGLDRVSANSAACSDEISQQKILYSLGNTHGSILYTNSTGARFCPEYFSAGSSSSTAQMIPDSPSSQGLDHSSTEFIASNNGAGTGVPLINNEIFYLNNLDEILLRGDHEEKNKLIVMLRGSYLWLMTNEHTHSRFQNFLNVCSKNQLREVARHILANENELFLKSAFINKGSKSIIRFIRKIRKLPEASTLTSLVSTKFWDLMTCEASKDIIPQCFLVLTEPANKVLYDKALEFSEALARHQIGCTSLNECISVAAGSQGLKLLCHVAKLSLHLSQDVYGNYVVQAILSLQRLTATALIFQCLRGHFVELSLQKSGSHVVEKCLAYSSLGTVLVCEEITCDPHTTLQVAQHQFGNYVIQKALVEAKKLPGRFIDIYNTLLEYLLLQREELYKQQYGRAVLFKLKYQNPDPGSR